MVMQRKNNRYSHLNQEKRIEIYVYLREWLSYREMWKRLKISHTTISREINRNKIDKWRWIYKYKPIEADKLYKERRYSANFNHIKLWKNDKLRLKIGELLKNKEKWWPDEILWRLKLEWYSVVSANTLYRFIREENPIRQRYLRFKYKWYRTQSKWNKRRKKIYNDVPNIKERLEITDLRWRVWDFEWDTVVSGHKHKWWLATLTDRMSRYCLFKKVWNLKAQTLNITIKAMLYWEKVESIIFDNWVEFSDISQLWIQCYRADTYASYQRWTNEKHNWYIRRFIPKWANINDRTDNEIQKMQDIINHKPRKILGYKTPYEVYYNTNLIYIK